MSESDYLDEADFGSRRNRQEMSGCAKVAIGCGVVAMIAAIAVGVGLWWVANNVRELGADAASAAMKEGLKELKLPADQQQRIFDRIDEVAQSFKDEKITLEEVGLIFKKISEGPLIPAGMVLVVERAYLDKSGFEDEEKEAARVTIQRFTHGAVREMISQAKVDSVLDTISTKTGRNDERKFRHPVTDEELRKFIAAAKLAADEANIPEEVPKVNFADEFDKAIDEGLRK